MAVLKIANIHFDLTGTNRLDYSNSVVKLTANGLILPSGTTANRPPDGVGTIRYNTTTGRYEAYFSTGWANVTSQNDSVDIGPAFNKANDANLLAFQVGGAVSGHNTVLSTVNTNITTAQAKGEAAHLTANQVGGAVTTANTNITTAQAKGAAAHLTANTAQAKGEAAHLTANQVGGAVTTANTNITTAQAKGAAAHLTANAAFDKANTGGSDYIMRTYTGPATWTKPATVKAVKVTVVGGGANGAPSGPLASSPTSVTSLGFGGGGGSGGVAIYHAAAPLIPGPISVTVGTVGGTSSFGPLASATGGTAGSSQVEGSVDIWHALGGAGGTATGGTVNIDGQNGGDGSGRVSSTSPSTVNFAAKSGFGGSTILGSGGSSVTVTNTPGPQATTSRAGKGYGAGGSGAMSGGGTGTPTRAPQTGGIGTQGIIIVEEFY